MNDNTKLKQMLKTIDPKVDLTIDAEKMILLMARDFIRDVTDGSCRIAECRKSTDVDVVDLAIYLKKMWDIDVEGHSITTTNSDMKKEIAL